jgi:hypothetical protein
VIQVLTVTLGGDTSSIGLTAGGGTLSAVLDLFRGSVILLVFRLVVTFPVFHVGHLEVLPFLVVFEQVGGNGGHKIGFKLLAGFLFLDVFHSLLVDMNTLMDDGVYGCPRVFDPLVRKYHKDVGTRTIGSTSKLFRKRGNLDFVPLAPILNFLLCRQTIPRRERGHFVPLHVVPLFPQH